MQEIENEIILGKIGAVYGIKGWLKLHSFTDEPEAILDYFPWSIKMKGSLRSIEVSDWKRYKNSLVVKLAGVDDRDLAQQFVNAEIVVDSKVLPDLPEGEFYWRDLIGMTVVNSQGYDFGVVDDILETGSNDVLVVKANRNDAFGKQERLIPYTFDEAVISVCAEDKKINVDWDPGF